MNRPAHSAAPPSEPTIKMHDGWHCLHLYYRVCQSSLSQLSENQRATGREEFIRLCDPNRPGAPARLQTSVVSGHKADLSLLIMDPDPLVIDSVQQGIRASLLGSVLVPSYSFVSITEVSEYVPTVEQYGERLRAAGTPVTVRRYDDLAHGFLGLDLIVDRAREARAETIAALRDALGAPKAAQQL